MGCQNLVSVLLSENRHGKLSTFRLMHKMFLRVRTYMNARICLNVVLTCVCFVGASTCFTWRFAPGLWSCL